MIAALALIGHALSACQPTTEDPLGLAGKELVVAEADNPIYGIGPLKRGQPYENAISADGAHVLVSIRQMPANEIARVSFETRKGIRFRFSDDRYSYGDPQFAPNGRRFLVHRTPLPGYSLPHQILILEPDGEVKSTIGECGLEYGQASFVSDRKVVLRRNVNPRGFMPREFSKRYVQEDPYGIFEKDIESGDEEQIFRFAFIGFNRLRYIGEDRYIVSKPGNPVKPKIDNTGRVWFVREIGEKFEATGGKIAFFWGILFPQFIFERGSDGKNVELFDYDPSGISRYYGVSSGFWPSDFGRYVYDIKDHRQENTKRKIYVSSVDEEESVLAYESHAALIGQPSVSFDMCHLAFGEIGNSGRDVNGNIVQYPLTLLDRCSYSDEAGTTKRAVIDRSQLESLPVQEIEMEIVDECK